MVRDGFGALIVHNVERDVQVQHGQGIQMVNDAGQRHGGQAVVAQT
jgi:hypothetical protein